VQSANLAAPARAKDRAADVELLQNRKMDAKKTDYHSKVS
jgi:hypothetical protein